MPNLNPHDPDDIIKREKITVYINYQRFWTFLKRQKVLEILLSHKDIYRTYFIFLGLIVLISTLFPTSLINRISITINFDGNSFKKGTDEPHFLTMDVTNVVYTKLPKKERRISWGNI